MDAGGVLCLLQLLGFFSVTVLKVQLPNHIQVLFDSNSDNQICL